MSGSRNIVEELQTITTKFHNYINESLDSSQLSDITLQYLINAYDNFQQELSNRYNLEKVEEPHMIESHKTAIVDAFNYTLVHYSLKNLYESTWLENWINKKIQESKVFTTDMMDVVKSAPDVFESIKNPAPQKEKKTRSKFYHSLFGCASRSKKPADPVPDAKKTAQQETSDFTVPLDADKFKDYALRLTQCTSDSEAKECLHKFIKKEGSLYNHFRSKINSFSNLFLINLRHANIEAYKELIRKRYGFKFLTGEQLLYRGDTRKYDVIFERGFELMPESNRPETRKHIYNRMHAGSVGVSLSKSKEVAQGFGYYGYYKVHLPPNHRLLIADLGPFSSAREVNSLDNIPPEYIESFISNDGREYRNPNFILDANLGSPQIRRGCY